MQDCHKHWYWKNKVLEEDYQPWLPLLEEVVYPHLNTVCTISTPTRMELTGRAAAPTSTQILWYICHFITSLVVYSAAAVVEDVACCSLIYPYLQEFKEIQLPGYGLVGN